MINYKITFYRGDKIGSLYYRQFEDAFAMMEWAESLEAECSFTSFIYEVVTLEDFLLNTPN